jgi:hypothetical protein
MKSAVLTLCVLLCLAAPARAQEVSSRTEWLRQQRAEKAQQLEPYTPTRLERAVLKIENDYLPRLFVARSGFYPRIGSFTSGGGFALGPGHRLLGLFDGRANLATSAALSYKNYWIVESVLDAPRLARGRHFASAHVRYTSFPEEDYFGMGPDSTRVDRVSYALSQASAGVEAGTRPAPWARVGGRVEYIDADIGRGSDDRFPDLAERFDESSAPGLESQPGFFRVGGYAQVDYARPLNARQGGRYTVAVHRYLDTAGGAYTFNRVDVDLQQYLSAFNERRVFALRALGSFTDPAGDATVPFYLMATLGGNHTLRGFRAFRFRDRSEILLQAEYRFEILTALDGAVFYDTGQVAPRMGALSWRDFERDYGVGLRVGTNAGVFIRFDVAFGSGEGTKTWLRFTHVF